MDLLELQTLVREVLEDSFAGKVWVRAEIASLKARPGSHCYMELSRSDRAGSVVAKVRAVAWASSWRMISAYFHEVTGSYPAEGMEVLLQVQVSYSQIYGLSLTVADIDPEFTLGAGEDQRRRTVARLEEEGLLDMQKELAPPDLPYRIAVVSAPDAAGYRDFMRHLHDNEYGFVFHTELFPALMQGADAPRSVAEALSQAAASQEPFDVVMIMRGGGAKLDLACFDEYEMAAAIARCPLPVMTAIGHDQDYHVADMAACMHVKTPTALADWLLDIYCAEDEVLVRFGTRLRLAFLNKVTAMETRVENLGQRIRSADPRNILSRGYALAVGDDGRVVRSVSSLSAGRLMRVMFPDGTAEVLVREIHRCEPDK